MSRGPAPSTSRTLREWVAACLVASVCVLCVMAPGSASASEDDDDDGRERHRSHRISGPRRESYDASLPVPIVDAAGLLRGGQTVVVHWEARHSIEECELLLSIDGGRTFELRISPELEGDRSHYAWRVPNLSAHDARIRLRARVRGHEVEGPVSGRMRIVSDTERPRERWLFREGGFSEDIAAPARAEHLGSNDRAEFHLARSQPMGPHEETAVPGAPGAYVILRPLEDPALPSPDPLFPPPRFRPLLL